MNKIYKNAQSGFTLIELLLVISLLAISFGMTTDILLTLMRSYNKTTVINEIEQQASFVAQKLEREIRAASRITTGSGPYITFTNDSGATITYASANNILYRYVGGYNATLHTISNAMTINSAVPGIVTGVTGGVRVTCPTTCFVVSTNPSPSIVTVNMEFTQYQTAANVSYSGKVVLNTTVIARNTY